MGLGLYRVEFLLPRELTSAELMALRSEGARGFVTATNVVDHPFPENGVVQEFATPVGYYEALIMAPEKGLAMARVGDSVRAVLDETRPSVGRARLVCLLRRSGQAT